MKKRSFFQRYCLNSCKGFFLFLLSHFLSHPLKKNLLYRPQSRQTWFLSFFFFFFLTTLLPKFWQLKPPLFYKMFSEYLFARNRKLYAVFISSLLLFYLDILGCFTIPSYYDGWRRPLSVEQLFFETFLLLSQTICEFLYLFLYWIEWYWKNVAYIYEILHYI